MLNAEPSQCACTVYTCRQVASRCVRPCWWTAATSKLCQRPAQSWSALVTARRASGYACATLALSRSATSTSRSPPGRSRAAPRFPPGRSGSPFHTLQAMQVQIDFSSKLGTKGSRYGGFEMQSSLVAHIIFGEALQRMCLLVCIPACRTSRAAQVPWSKVQLCPRAAVHTIRESPRGQHLLLRRPLARRPAQAPARRPPPHLLQRPFKVRIGASKRWCMAGCQHATSAGSIMRLIVFPR